MKQIKNGAAQTAPNKELPMKNYNLIIQHYMDILNRLITIDSLDVQYCPMCEMSHENNTNCQR